MSKTLCFKPTRNVHESGYRYIQYGYISYHDGEEKIEIIGRYDILSTPFDVLTPFNIDLTKSGWFRILPRKYQKLEWRYGGTLEVVADEMNYENQSLEVKS